MLRNSSTFRLSPRQDSTLYVRAFNDPDSCKSPYTPVQATVIPAPQVNFETDTACAGSSVDLKGQAQLSQGTLTQFSWDLGDGRSLNGKQVQPTYNNSGTFQVTFSATSDQGCQADTQQPVKVKASPEANFASDTVCFGSAFTLTEKADPNGTSIQGYQWDLDNGQSVSGPSFNPDYSAAGNYAVTFTVEAANSCKDAMTKNVALLPAPEAPIFRIGRL